MKAYKVIFFQNQYLMLFFKLSGLLFGSVNMLIISPNVNTNPVPTCNLQDILHLLYIYAIEDKCFQLGISVFSKKCVKNSILKYFIRTRPI